MDQQGLFHLARVDVRAAGYDEVLRPVAERQAAVGAQEADIAGAKPSLLDGLAAGIVIVPVPAHDDIAATQYLADLSSSQAVAALVGDRQLDTGPRPADRSENGV